MLDVPMIVALKILGKAKVSLLESYPCTLSEVLLCPIFTYEKA